MIRVAYVVDHKLRRHDQWAQQPLETTIVKAIDPTQQAAELGERFELRNAPIVEAGHQIRVRVWHYASDAELFAIDPDTDEPAGQWTYGPHPTD